MKMNGIWRSFRALQAVTSELDVQSAAKILRISKPYGSVKVTGNDSSTVRVDAIGILRPPQVAADILVNGDAIDVSMPAHAKVIGLELNVPRGLHVQVRGNQGSHDVRGMLGNVDIQLTQGSVNACDLEGALSVVVDQGSVSGRDLRGGVQVHGGSGSVDLRQSRLPACGSTEVRLHDGSVDIAVPRGSVINAAVSTEAGSAKVRVAKSAEGYPVHAFTKTGSISIKESP